jgi:hypothetical protein
MSDKAACDICIHNLVSKDLTTGCLDYPENYPNRASICCGFESIAELGVSPLEPESALDKQVGGSHYQQYEIQPYEFLLKNQIPHHKAAIIRRILRYDHETGHGITDLNKIIHEVELIKEIEGWKE